MFNVFVVQFSSKKGSEILNLSIGCVQLLDSKAKKPSVSPCFYLQISLGVVYLCIGNSTLFFPVHLNKEETINHHSSGKDHFELDVTYVK